MNQGMSPGSWLSQFISILLIHRKNIFSVITSFKVKCFLKKKSQKMLFTLCIKYLNKENRDSVKVFSGLVITLRTKQGRFEN